MKKYISFVCAFLIITNYNYSQYNNCEEDCENSVTVTQTVTVTFGLPDCAITITLDKTTCGDGKILIRIKKLETSTYNECGQPDAGPLMVAAIHGLIVDNPMNLQALRQKFIYPSCWRYTDYTFTEAVPCNEEQCCTIEFLYDNSCNRLLPINITSTGVKFCYGTASEALQPGCFNACFSDIETFESNLKDLDENN